MRVVLAIPPFAAPFSPLLGAPLLAAQLEERGHEVVVRDYSLRALVKLWNRESVEAGIDFIGQKIGHLEERRELPRLLAEDYFKWVERFLPAEVVRRDLDWALEVLQSNHGGEDWSDLGEYDRALEVLQAALNFASAPFYPERVSLRRYMPPRPIEKTSDLIEYASRSAEESLFGKVLLEEAPDEMLAVFGDEKVDAIGLSITWMEQLAPAAMLASGLRRAGYEGVIIWGGALIAHLEEDLRYAEDLKKTGLMDAFIPFHGVEEFEAIGRALELGETLDGIEGLVIPNLTKPPELTFSSGRRPHGELPTPNLKHLRFEDYLSPRPIVPLLASVGCYHQACAFCDHFHSVAGYRPRKIASVIEDMKKIYAETGCRDFYLVDDCTPPKTMYLLAQELIKWREEEGGPAIRWITECRAERLLLKNPDILPTLAKSGCQMLIFGMESADDRVLDSMGKGVTVEQIREVFKAVKRAGIKVWAFYMLGFPTETEEAARRTHEFMREMRDIVDVFAGGPFLVTRHSPIAHNSQAYGIRIKPPKKPKKKFLAKGKKKRKSHKLVAAPLNFIAPYEGGKLSSKEVDELLAEIDRDPLLAHYRHPLVIEAHGLFLSENYYHRLPEPPSPLPMSGEGIHWQRLMAMRVASEKGVSITYTKFPSLPSLLPSKGALKESPTALLFHLHRELAPMAISFEIADLINRCREAPKHVASLVAELISANPSYRPNDILMAIAQLVQFGYLKLYSPRL